MTIQQELPDVQETPRVGTDAVAHTLHEFVAKHAVRGACQCGKCFDAVANPETHQPTGHTADLVFFKVAAIGDPKPDAFLALVKAEHPEWLDGKEHSCICRRAAKWATKASR